MALDRVRWDCAPYSYAAAARLQAELGVSPVVAAVLVRRGLSEPAAARAFLDAADRHDAHAIEGMDAACRRILAHVQKGSRIVIHGDYDVDGVCSTAILVRGLRRLGADVSFHLPAREDGYGLSIETVERLGAAGTRLIVTVDCGVSSAPEVARAAALGVEMVVTDHHRPGGALPDCPIVHPALGGYPCPDLCAAGVSNKLVEALYAAAGEDPRTADGDLDLVALATVCDVVPLTGENRRLVREGLIAMARTRKPGLRALMRVAGVEPGSLDAGSLGFRLGPRINAAGRLQRADAALELILCEDERRAAEIADELDLLNRQRQDVETRILFAAEAARVEQDAQAAYVIAGEGWHPGVIGIVASRLVERHHRPCVLIALGADGGRGSGRSIPAFDLHAGLSACSSHLRRFGGHRVAAGLEIDADRVDAFRRDFAAHAAAALLPEDLVAVQRVDAVVPAGALGLELAEELERLAPFGAGHREPRLLVPAARVGDVRSMGEEATHARFTLSAGGARARAVAFRTPAGSLRGLGDEPQDVCVRLERNEWNGAVEPRLVLGGLRRTTAGVCEVLGEEGDFWTAVYAELDAEPSAWPVPTVPAGAAAAAAAARHVIDRRARGFAGVAGDLVSSGERVLVVCADVARRRAGLDAVVGGLGAALGADAAEALAVTGWRELAAAPALAARFEHVVALDPPPHPAGIELLSTARVARTSGFAHLAWGEPEAAFALRVAEAELDLRPALAETYRALRAAGTLERHQLAAALRGAARHPRPAAICGRLLRVLAELELAELDRDAVLCRLVEGAERTQLERSPAFRAYAARLAEGREWLARCCVAGQPAAAGARQAA